jgi:putative membrane protein
MDTPVGEKPAADLRDYLAEERTFLAWIRTGLTLMGFGFVVARFGLFLQVMQITQGGSAAQSHGLSPWIGTAFIAAGVAVNLLSIRRHLRLVGDLNRGQFADRGPSRMAVILALFLALVGAAMALYLILP